MTRHLALIAVVALSLAGVVACGESASDGERQHAKGELKEGVGGLIGDKEMKREGQKDQVIGGVKQTVEDVGDAVKSDEKK